MLQERPQTLAEAWATSLSSAVSASKETGGLWFIFIGWFIQNLAVGSYRQVVLQDVLQGHRVRALGLITLHNIKQVPRELRSRTTLGEAMTPIDKLKWVGPKTFPAC